MSEKDYNYPIETLSPNDFDEWAEHCGTVFHDTGTEYFRRHFIADPHKDYNSIFLVKNEEGKIISTVRVFHRQAYIGGKIYKMGGIGEVSTNVDYRRMGLSYKLLETATDYMNKNDFDLSMLGTGYFSHYAKHGFMQINRYGKSVSVDLKIESADIRPLNSDNFHDMAVLYNKYCSNLNCCIVRTKEYWQSWCAGEINNPRGLFRDGKLVGYICVDGRWVEEIAADENDYDILLSAVKPDDGKIRVPAFVKTVREIAGTECFNNTMICVYKPIEIKGIVLSDTAAVVDYINNSGGIMWWRQDGF